MTTTLNQAAGDESWGIREFELFVSPCPEKCKLCTKETLETCDIFTQAASSWQLNKDLTADGWSIEKGKEGTTVCSGVQLFGGFKLFGKGAAIQKQFPLPTHNKFVLRFQFWKIDSWDNEQMMVYVDNILVHKQAFRNQGFKVSVCGAANKGWNEEVEDVQISLDHTAPNAVVKITTTLNQAANDESWGIRDFEIFTDSQNKLV